MPSIFLDTNIPMYAAGAAHALKQPSIDTLRLVEKAPGSFITNAEVLQEILHRYVSIQRWQQGRRVLLRFSNLMRGRTEPVYSDDVVRAAELADRYPRLDARDLLHTAVMHRLGVRLIVSADTKFDSVAGIERLDPIKIEEWRDTVTA
jgi:predicted nucleic acid-binding protein